jgi:hypothetical protein
VYATDGIALCGRSLLHCWCSVWLGSATVVVAAGRATYTFHTPTARTCSVASATCGVVSTTK